MKKYTLLLTTIIIVLASLTTSCENEIDYTIGQKDSKLVINALINADSIRNDIYLSNSGGYGATAERNAIIKVYINNELKVTVDKAETDNNNIAALYRINCKFKINDRVKIDVATKDGSKRAWTEVKVLPPTPIEKIDVSTKTYIDNVLGAKEHIQLKIEIKDHSNNEDIYYRLITEQYLFKGQWWDYDKNQLQTIYYKSLSMYIDNDFVLMDGNPISSSDNNETVIETTYNCYRIFSNRLFKNKSYALNITIPNRSDLSYAIIRLLRISKEEYQYFKSLNMIDSDTFGKDFSEPITIETNVNGGLGIIGISSESSKRIEFIKK